jgi:hypothetical protein
MAKLSSIIQSLIRFVRLQMISCKNKDETYLRNKLNIQKMKSNIRFSQNQPLSSRFDDHRTTSDLRLLGSSKIPLC